MKWSSGQIISDCVLLFCSEKPVPQKTFPIQGTLINTNTIEAFRTYNKMELIQSVGQQVV